MIFSPFQSCSSYRYEWALLEVCAGILSSINKDTRNVRFCRHSLVCDKGLHWVKLSSALKEQILKETHPSLILTVLNCLVLFSWS